MAHEPTIKLSNGHVLQPTGELDEAHLAIQGSQICDDVKGADLTIDCSGLHVLPGIVDVHGDAFERELFPRPGVGIDFPIAMNSVDAQLAANGITTAYHGLTLSWEPGARSIEAGRDFMYQLKALGPKLGVDHRVQLRWETFAHDAVDDVIAWLSEVPKPVVAFNDHTTSTLEKVTKGRHKKIEQWAARAGLSVEAYLARANEVAELVPDVPAKIAEVAEAARALGVVTLSHDDRTLGDRAMYRALGSTVCEFPLALEVAKDAVANGEPTVLGGPNIIRGGSHTGALSAEDAIRDGLCTILASDYYYPSLLHAVDRLVKGDVLDLGRAWALISRHPAAAMKLDDRGELATGRRADVIVVDFRDMPKVMATIVAGKVVYRAI